MSTTPLLVCFILLAKLNLKCRIVKHHGEELIFLQVALMIFETISSTCYYSITICWPDMEFIFHGLHGEDS
jgi:hypothetical protein